MSSVTSRAADRLERALEPALRTAEAAASDPIKSPRTAVVVGRLLAIAFLTCFATGLFSHVLQDPPGWLPLPTRPIDLYRWTQGLHVIAGIASVPLLLAKLWTVYPRLFERPVLGSAARFAERASIAVLVGAALVEVAIGLLNIVQWYVFPFSFRRVHLALAWVVVGSLAIHIGVKLPLIVRHWSRAGQGADAAVPAEPAGRADAAGTTTAAPRADAAGRFVSRRGFLGGVAVATAAVVATTAGQTVGLLAPLNVFAPRRIGVGPQGLPVNRTAVQAGVTATATSPEWALEVTTPSGVSSFTLDDLRAMPQTVSVLPIACVEGWSQEATWRGVRMVDLLERVGAVPRHPLVVSSLQTRGAYAVTEMPPEYALDPLTLVALELNGSPLDLDHGYPARVIAPARPGVMQTKWLRSIEVTA
ncbi:DMSO/TMAO reductase YedYZ molybdopterin-dependent catalytic subunit [Agromyces terreus]|uniref:DMSO/TMAO reductase YedYZ molybdopterin-dependent catalytic subunit n=1 Tax=Agromyces terreus TaxID=424795 RepID=A0A9X2KE12_9MICO|nr:molybdopterin-dependent oxidoreductase [Agromyces terreus]MCP2370137.1 DMSO/TMAO reductase YedYZ molybdopterin-dependent catalytic subunit [Agromyces terreus]